MEGWIKIYREILRHWIIKNPKYFTAWIIMILTVNHESSRVLIHGELIECKRGQSLLSLPNWTKLFGRDWSIQKVRTFFELLKNDSMINMEGLRKTTRITICNYDSYQNKQQTNNTESNRQTTDKQQTGNIKQEEEERKELKEDKKNPEPEKIPALPKLDIINSIIQEFKTVFPEYVITTPGKEKNMAGKLLQVFKKEYPDLNSDDMLKSLRTYFEACKNIDDPWHKIKMSLAHMVNQYNVINAILKSGSKKKGKLVFEPDLSEQHHELTPDQA